MNQKLRIPAFVNKAELYVGRTLLESEGIRTEIENDHTEQTYPFLAHVMGGPSLLVDAEDYERALELLEEAGYLENKKEEQGIIQNYLSKPENLASAKKWGKAFLVLAGIIVFVFVALKII